MDNSKCETLNENSLLDIVEHELICLNGLYASDNPNFTESFQLDFSELLEKIEKEKHSQK